MIRCCLFSIWSIAVMLRWCYQLFKSMFSQMKAVQVKAEHFSSACRGSRERSFISTQALILLIGFAEQVLLGQTELAFSSVHTHIHTCKVQSLFFVVLFLFPPPRPLAEPFNWNHTSASVFKMCFLGEELSQGVEKFLGEWSLRALSFFLENTPVKMRSRCVHSMLVSCYSSTLK